MKSFTKFLVALFVMTATVKVAHSQTQEGIINQNLELVEETFEDTEDTLTQAIDKQLTFVPASQDPDHEIWDDCTTGDWWLIGGATVATGVVVGVTAVATAPLSTSTGVATGTTVGFSGAVSAPVVTGSTVGAVGFATIFPGVLAGLATMVGACQP